ncbi:S24 family peptidase [Methyloceanibacter stevinii]|uniref:S24 family peptidase n=1 Tax=Methyloceanibacter stevinii TaxID=1774970 RepID=UPI00084971A9|nr:S24 family peptidase [Methyloceanibacter stevinii]
MGEEKIRQEQGRRLTEARKAAGYKSAREAALMNGWNENTYRAHEKGRRTIGLDDAQRYSRRFHSRGAACSAQSLLFGDDAPDGDDRPGRHIIPIMGFVGAGGDIEPDYEQVPPEGLDQIELHQPCGLARDPIGFRIRGESMMPRYNDGEIVIVERDQPYATDSMIGLEAVVRTAKGNRYLKRIKVGSRRNTFDLVSLGAVATMESVRIAWASPVLMIIPNVGLRRKRL